MDGASVQPRVALLVFADSQARDLRRRALPAAAAPLLRLPDMTAVSARIDVHWFTDRPSRTPRRGHLEVHSQRGRDFGQRLRNAVDQLADRGYDRIIIVGRDCPQLTAGDINRAAELLDSNRLVVGPDHRGGCWLIALHTADRQLLSQVRWQHDTDAAQLLGIFGARSAVVLETRFDLDGADDLRLFARKFALATALTALLLLRPVAPSLTPRRALVHQRRSVQLPPPLHPRPFA